MSLTYSIIIPAWNEEALLAATLVAIHAARQSLPGDGEVIVVDNNSSDATAQVAAANGARVVFEPINQISRARNAGARAAAGACLFFVDADTLVSGDLLRAARELIAGGQACGCGSVLQFDLEGAQETASFRQAVRTWNWISRRLGLAAGSFIACRREAFADIGGFSDKVFAGEEIFFSWGLKRWGRRQSPRQRLCIIPDHPVLTSARKMLWYGPWRLLAAHAILGLFPFLLLNRRFCGFWYRRDAAAAQPGAS